MNKRHKLSKVFRDFAEKECEKSSVLYQYLSEKVAEDKEMLKLCINVREDQPVPNSLFGAVHYLLLKGCDHPLKYFYPSITVNYKQPVGSFHTFKDFCMKYEMDILKLFKYRYIQTNEVRRCAYLYPAFCTIYERTEKPLALIEIGTSAGLQLLWDKYSYSYGDNNIYGNKNSNLHIETELKGENHPELRKSSPPVTVRVGIDLNPIDLKSDDEKLWLKALIWPEHKERLYMFEKATNYIRNNKVNLIEGDGIALLGEIVRDIPSENSICIFHTHVANQMPPEKRKELLQLVKDLGKERDVSHIYNNIQDNFLHMDHYIEGEEKTSVIADTDGHGRWFEWLL